MQKLFLGGLAALCLLAPPANAADSIRAVRDTIATHDANEAVLEAAQQAALAAQAAANATQDARLKALEDRMAAMAQAAVAVAPAPTPAPVVTTPTLAAGADLAAALKAAKPGAVVRLAGGIYPAAVVDGLRLAPGITITSADPSARAQLSGLILSNCAGLTFDQVDLVSTGPLVDYYPFRVTNCADVVFTRDGFRSDETQRSGLRVEKSQRISVTDGDFRHLGHGVNFSGNTGLTLERNRFSALYVDGMIGASSGLTIRSNFITGFITAAGAAHADFIQILDEPAAVTDLLIEANLAVVTDPTAPTQNIFIVPTGTAANARIKVLNNLSIGAAYEGINIQAFAGVEVAGNRLFTPQGFSWTNRLSISQSSNVSSHDNVADKIIYGNSFNPTDFNTAITVTNNASEGPPLTPAQISAEVAAFRAKHPEVPN